MPYTYGSGSGTRTYWPKNAPAVRAELTKAAEDACGCRFELCFANGYAGEREHLGWHADDSPEIDDGKAHVVGLETFGEPTKARGGFPPLSSPAPEPTTP